MNRALKTIPFNQITFYKGAYYPPCTRIYTIIKNNKVLNPVYFDKLYYTIPVRSQHQAQKDNCILAFLCERQAFYYCQELNKEDNLIYNHNEPHSDCCVDDYTIKDLSYNAYMLATQLCVVCNMFCEGQMEPTFCVMMIDKPIVNIVNT